MKPFIIITTIYPKSEAISAFENYTDCRMVVVGDKKSHPMASTGNLTFLSVEEQLKLDYRLAGQCPFNHYSRKNIGYLYAIQGGADIIFDTDDDNIPYPGWELPHFDCDNEVVSNARYINIYSHFTNEFIWPRGFPLDEIQAAKQNPFKISHTSAARIGIWQGLTDDEPDTDAIYRLLLNKKIKFEKKESIYLQKRQFCPINSQNTCWRREVFPYLYLPVTVSFRFTDILRGYIAQVLMWHQGFHVGFTGAALYQKRNPHNLMKDLVEELESYIHIKRILELIENTKMTQDPCANLENVYRRLAKASLVKPEELHCLDAWITDYKKYCNPEQ